MLRTLKDVAGRQGFADPAIAHAMQVRAAVQANDYLRFFRLLRGAPNLGGKLMGTYVERVRFAALQCLCRSYAPSVAVALAAKAQCSCTPLHTCRRQHAECGGAAGGAFVASLLVHSHVVHLRSRAG